MTASVKDIRYHTPPDTSPSDQRQRFMAFNETSLFVKCLPKSMKEDDLRHLFSPHGPIRKIKLDVNDNFPTNRAVIQMESKEACDSAIKALNRWQDGQGSIIYVAYHVPYHLRHSDDPYKKSNNAQRSPQFGGIGRGNALLTAVGTSTPGNPYQYTNAVGSSPSGNTYQYSDQYSTPNHYQRSPRRRGGMRGSTRGNYQEPFGEHRGSFRGGYRGRGRGYSDRSRFPPRSNYQNGEDMHPSQPPPLQTVLQCSQCLKNSNFRCSSCRVAPYCSRECQVKHWSTSHKTECSHMKEQGDMAVGSSATTFTGKAVVTSESTHKSLSNTSNRDSDNESICSSLGEEPGLPLNTPVKVKLTDFMSPSQFFVQMSEDASVAGRLPRVWECTLCDITLPNGESRWSEKVLDVCSASGLALGGLCTVTCLKRKGGVYHTKLVLRNGAVLSEQLAEAGLATLVSPPNVLEVRRKYKVKGSLHTKLEVGQNIEVVIDESSIHSISDFYAQIGGESVLEELNQFREMEPRLNSYGGHVANQPPPGYNPETYRAEAGDFVLAPYDGSIFRGEVTASEAHGAAVAFIDYGNLDAIPHDKLIPLPKQFTDLPAIAALCKLHGLKEVETAKDNELAVGQIKALAGDRVKAVVRSLIESCVTLDLYTDDGKNLSDILVKCGYAVSLETPVKQHGDTHSQVAANQQEVPEETNDDGPPPLVDTYTEQPRENGQTSSSLSHQHTAAAAATSQKVAGRKIYYEKNLVCDSFPPNTQTGVKVVNCTDLNAVYIQSADTHAEKRYQDVMDVVKHRLIHATPAATIHQGEVLLVVEPESEEWDRVVILDSTANSDESVRVRSIDYGSEYQVRRTLIVPMIPEAAELPMRAVKINLAGVNGKLSKTGIDFLNSMLQKQMRVALSTDSKGVTQCEMVFGNSDDSLNRVLMSMLIPDNISHTNGGAINRHNGSGHDLNSHGSEVDSDGSPTMPPLVLGSGDEQEDSRETRLRKLERMFEALQMEKNKLKKEIAHLQSQPIRSSSSTSTIVQEDDYYEDEDGFCL